ncbi:MAG: HAD hydrolase-like protein [Planctomycetaceae bacterium]|nr:HAD hydrolase-like protein [Planctomycetaceae bacterium]
MTNNIEADFRQVHDTGVTTRFLPGCSIEVIGDFCPGKPPEHVLFDFDGTLSLVREGWPEIMIPMMVEYLQETGTDEDPKALYDVCSKFVMELTGKQTIYQMFRLAAEIKQRGGTPLDPLEYKDDYHNRLMQRIESRRERLRTGEAHPSEMVVPGSIELLELLQKRDVPVYLASGTDEQYVREEVELLQLDKFFGRHVYGAQDDYKSFSKAQVIERILRENEVDGSSLLGFGDGYVEIQNIYDVGGTAIAVASDEANRDGRPDPWKRERLIGAGAHAVVPDYAEAERLIEWIWTGKE